MKSVVFADDSGTRLYPIDKEVSKQVLPNYDRPMAYEPISCLTRRLMTSSYNLRVTKSKTATWNLLAYENVPLKTRDKTFLRDVPENMYRCSPDEMPPRFV